MCLGVGAGVVNAQLDSVMSRKIRLSTVPAVIAVLSGKLQWFDKHFSVQNLRDFVRGLYPPDLIQEVLSDLIILTYLGSVLVIILMLAFKEGSSILW